MDSLSEDAHEVMVEASEFTVAEKVVNPHGNEGLLVGNSQTE